MPQFLAATVAHPDPGDASDDFIKEKLHSNICSSSPDSMTRPYYSSIDRISHCVSATWFGVAGFGVGSIAGMITVTILGKPKVLRFMTR
jgi:hypothetical protein